MTTVLTILTMLKMPMPLPTPAINATPDAVTMASACKIFATNEQEDVEENLETGEEVETADWNR